MSQLRRNVSRLQLNFLLPIYHARRSPLIYFLLMLGLAFMIVSKMFSRITGRSIAVEARTLTGNILLNMRDHWWSGLGHILRMGEGRLVRKILLNYVKPENQSLFGDIPNLNEEKAVETARERGKWKKHWPSRCC